MICTCDIPLSEISIHQMKYGKYGIGIDKSWAKKQNFSPVLYVSDKSDIYKRLTEYAEKRLVQPIVCSRGSFDEEYMLHYIKRVIGTDADREHLRMKLRPKFMNEHEWRYVPMDVPMSFTTKGKGQDIDCARLSELTKGKKIKLEAKDIKYIFIEKEKERIKIINEIQKIFREEGKDATDLLTSKVCSAEQMKEDF